MKKPVATPPQAKATADVSEALRAALKQANPELSNAALDDLVAQATDTKGAERAAARKPAAVPKMPGQPAFKVPAEYKLLEKAFFPSVKVKQDDEWMPLAAVLLDPAEQPLLNKLSGPFGGRGEPQRVALVIQYDGIPDEHMEPLNEAAEWMMDHIDEMKVHLASLRKTKRGRSRNPVDALSIIGHGATVLKEAQESV